MTTDAHNTESVQKQSRRFRSRASRCSLTGESSETLTVQFLVLLSELWPQALTTLILEDNGIGAVGAEHLGAALRVNQVKKQTSSFSFFYLNHDHRHSQHWVCSETKSAMKEQNISVLPCKRIKWDTHYRDSHSSITALATDTHYTAPWGEQFRRRRSRASRCRLASESSETLPIAFLLLTSQPWPQTLTTLNLFKNKVGDLGAEHLGAALRVNQVRHWPSNFSFFYLNYDHRHSQHWFLRITVSVL